MYHIGLPDEIPEGDPRADALSGSMVGLPPTYQTWDIDEAFAVDSEMLWAKLVGAGVPVGSSRTLFGLHELPVFDCPEAQCELALAHAWLKQYLATSH